MSILDLSLLDLFDYLRWLLTHPRSYTHRDQYYTADNSQEVTQSG